MNRIEDTRNISDLLGINAGFLRSLGDDNKAAELLRKTARVHQLSHHPDRGGDEKRFLEVQACIEAIAASGGINSIVSLISRELPFEMRVRQVLAQIDHIRELRSDLSAKRLGRIKSMLGDCHGLSASNLVGVRLTLLCPLNNNSDLVRYFERNHNYSYAHNANALGYLRQIEFDAGGQATVTEFGRQRPLGQRTIIGVHPTEEIDTSGFVLPPDWPLDQDTAIHYRRNYSSSRPDNLLLGAHAAFLTDPQNELISVEAGPNGGIEVHSEGRLIAVERYGVSPRAIGRGKFASEIREGDIELRYSAITKEDQDFSRAIQRLCVLIPNADGPSIDKIKQLIAGFNPDNLHKLLKSKELEHCLNGELARLLHSNSPHSACKALFDSSLGVPYGSLPAETLAKGLIFQLESHLARNDQELIMLCGHIKIYQPKVIENHYVQEAINHFLRAGIYRTRNPTTMPAVLKALGVEGERIDAAIELEFQQLPVTDAGWARMHIILPQLHDSGRFGRRADNISKTVKFIRAIFVDGIASDGLEHLLSHSGIEPRKIFEPLQSIFPDVKLLREQGNFSEFANNIRRLLGQDTAKFIKQAAVDEFIYDRLAEFIDARTDGIVVAEWGKVLFAEKIINQIVTDRFIEINAQVKEGVRPDAGTVRYLTRSFPAHPAVKRFLTKNPKLARTGDKAQ